MAYLTSFPTECLDYFFQLGNIFLPQFVYFKILRNHMIFSRRQFAEKTFSSTLLHLSYHRAVAVITILFARTISLNSTWVSSWKIYMGLVPCALICCKTARIHTLNFHSFQHLSRCFFSSPNLQFFQFYINRLK